MGRLARLLGRRDIAMGRGTCAFLPRLSQSQAENRPALCAAPPHGHRNASPVPPTPADHGSPRYLWRRGQGEAAPLALLPCSLLQFCYSIHCPPSAVLGWREKPCPLHPLTPMLPTAKAWCAAPS